MARRSVWLALILSVAVDRAEAAPQVLADPSAQGPVGFTPIRSLDRINGHPGILGTAPASGPSPAFSPTNPTASGPAAALPETPSGGEPVGMAPMPPIARSVEKGYRFGRISDLFRKDRSATPAPAAQPRSSRLAARPTPDAWSPDSTVRRAVHPDAVEAPAVAAPKARPAPFADRIPEAGRRQLDPKVEPADPAASPAPEGRPNPLSAEQPRRTRPRMEAEPGPSNGRPSLPSVAEYRPQGPRPQVGVSVAEAIGASGAPAQAPAAEAPGLDVVPPPPPPLEPDPPGRGEAPVVIPAPEAVPISTPSPSPAPEPAPEPPPIVEPSAAATAPEPRAEAPPPAEFNPPAEPAPMPSPAPLPELKPASPPPPADPAITRAGADSVAIRVGGPMGKDTQFATLRAAAVGDEVITLHELMVAVNERIHDYIDPTQRVSPEDVKAIKSQMAPIVLKSLIEQSLILQEAKRVMKSEKNLKAFNEHIDKLWKDEELPGLLRQYKVATEFELKAKLAEQGRIYDGLKEAYRKRMLSQEFIFKEVRNKATADTVELRAYYNLHQHDYDRPARMSWREVEVNQARYPDRAAARKQADALHARLAKGEDFAAVAKAASEGPTATKGGLYADITPGGYGILAVNDALGKLPIGQLSGVIEAPGSFHIVRVEGRRDAGPLHFDEVQDQIRHDVRNKNFETAVHAYLDKLRARTLVRTMFDAPERPKNDRLRANLKP